MVIDNVGLAFVFCSTFIAAFVGYWIGVFSERARVKSERIADAIERKVRENRS